MLKEFSICSSILEGERSVQKEFLCWHICMVLVCYERLIYREVRNKNIFFCSCSFMFWNSV